MTSAFGVRELLAQPLSTAMTDEMAAAIDPWRLEGSAQVVSDTTGCRLLARALKEYRGTAARVELGLRMPAQAWADYFSLHQPSSPEWTPLGITAVRPGEGADRLAIELPYVTTTIHFPTALTAAGDHVLPTALLMPIEHDVHLMFANQIALAALLARRAKQSYSACIRGLLSRQRQPLAVRVGHAFRDIHPSADVHPTAVIEGSIIGPGCRVGAHCTVRFSVLGANVRMHDGAIAEWSVVGDRTWLMHGLTVYRTMVERDCFLIHGPYQFSTFHAASSAFAAILMDYRPDGKPIRVLFPDGPRAYAGRFLGAVVGARARLLGGSLIAPGRMIAPGQWLGVAASGIHVRDQPVDAPLGVSLPPGTFVRNS